MSRWGGILYIRVWFLKIMLVCSSLIAVYVPDLCSSCFHVVVTPENSDINAVPRLLSAMRVELLVLNLNFGVG